MKTVAILGPTASGKTDVALRLARRFDAVILSLDSLAVYRRIDIASAKPTPKERHGIPHFGIDVIEPDMAFSVSLFIDIYRDAARFCETEEKPLLIVGGTGFYLKMLMDGLSDLPAANATIRHAVDETLEDLSKAYATLETIDPAYAAKIPPTDRYRIAKGLEIYYTTGQTPKRWFDDHPPKPILSDATLLEISLPKERLWKRIEARTAAMFRQGLVDEVANLEKRYGRAPHPMKAIGIQEVLDYFDGKRTLPQTQEAIAIHTRQLAKRQRTFNTTQLPDHFKGDLEAVEAMAVRSLKR